MNLALRLQQPTLGRGRRVLIAGGAGYANAGDEALLLAAVQIVRKSIGEGGHIDVTSPDRSVTSHTLRGENVHLVPTLRTALFRGDAHYARCDEVFQQRWHIFRSLVSGVDSDTACRIVQQSDLLDYADRDEVCELLASLAACDALVVHGGGILTSHTRSRLWEQALLTELASAWGKGVLLRSHQWGPFNSEDDRNLAAGIARRARFRSSRDLNQSSITMRQLCPDAPIIDQVDDALRLRLPDGAKPVLERLGLKPRRYIAVGLRENAGVGVDWTTTLKVARIVELAQQRLGLPVVLVPQNRPDFDRLRVLGEILRPRVEPFVLGDPFRDPIYLAENARLMIATPHHSLIFALRSGTPVLSPISGDYYRFKNIGSLRFFNAEKYVVDLDIEDTWISNAFDLLKRIDHEGDDLIESLRTRAASCQRYSVDSDRDFSEVLNNDSPETLD